MTLFTTAVLLLAASVRGQTDTFTLNGISLGLQDTSTDVGVLFTSMRFNRAANVWNVEVSVTNQSTHPVNGPFVLRVDSFAGTSGPLFPDGVDSSSKPFFDLSGTVSGGTLSPGARSVTRTLSLGVTSGTPSLTTRQFAAPPAAPSALALTRTLDDAGLPLPGVQVIENGPAGILTYYSDPVFGVVTLGQGTGLHTWKFSAPGYLPVWRSQTLTSNNVLVLPDPRLPRRAANSIIFTPIAGGTVSNASGNVQIVFAPGAFTQNATGTLTALTGQLLPGFLPSDWSPLQAFSIEFDHEPNQPGTAVLGLFGNINIGEPAAVARWNPTTVQWDVLQILAGSGGSNLTVSVPGSGVFAVVVADAPPLAPPTAQAGLPLPASSAAGPDPSSLGASGTVQPDSSPASRTPELVTGNATVIVTNPAGPLPSGLLLRGQVREGYALTDGTSRHTPQYESFVVGYQRPGSGVGLQAGFPLRPLLLFGPEDLQQATVTMDVLAPTPFSGGVLDTNGGLVGTEDISVLAGAGDLVARQAVQVRKLDPANFADFNGSGLPQGISNVVAAFELSIAGVTPGRHLAVEFGPMPTNAPFVLARVLYDQGLYGLQPVERLVSDAQGRLASAESFGGNSLNGIAGAGQYLLLRLSSPQALVTGTARNSAGQPAGGLPVSITGQPWLSFSGADGSFRLLAPTGAVQVAVTDLASGNTGSTSISVSNAQPTAADVAVVAAGPQVVSVSPTNGATAVARVSPIIVTFNKAVNPATLLAGGLQLLGSNAVPVPASLTLNLKNTVATLLPTEQLDPSTVYTVALTTNVTDPTGQALQGPNLFSFSTESDVFNRTNVQLIIWQPGATNIPPDVRANIPAFTPGADKAAIVVEGTAGSAEPGRPVILLNESSGDTSTVLSKPDGSFYGLIEGGEDDFVSATFVNANGTRNYLPVSRQLFDNGFVGLYPSGGILEAQGDGGPVQVIVEPNSISSRTTYQLEAVDSARLLTALQGLMPTNGEVILGGFALSQTGDDPSVSPHVSFPVDAAALGLPSGAKPEDASFALVTPAQTEDGQTVYQVVDQMFYENGKLVTHSFTGPRLQQILKLLVSSKQLSKATTILHALGLPSLQETALHELFLPIMISQGTSLGINGHTRSVALDAQGNPIPSTLRTESGAVVTGSRGVNGSRQGRLITGDLFTTSDQNGSFLLLFPVNRLAGDAFELTATHPAFPGIVADANVQLGSLSQFQFSLSTDLIFQRVAPDLTAGPDVTPPNIVISSAPRDPAPGTNAADGATITVAAVDDQALSDLTLTVDTASLATLNPGTTNLPNVTLLLVPNSQINTAQRARQLSYTLTCDQRAIVKLDATATDNSGNQRSSSTLIVFAGDQPPPPNTGNTNAPRVLATWPADGATGVTPGTPVTVLFSKALDPASVANVAKWLTIGGSGQLSSVKLAPDNKSLGIFFSGTATQPVTFTINQNLIDSDGNAFDQFPGQDGNQSFTWTLNLAGGSQTALSDINFGGGAVVKGSYLFALDRSPGGSVSSGAVVVFDLSTTPPAKVASISLAGPARDLVLIPNYKYKLHDSGPFATGDLLAVVGGILDPDAPFQYLRIFDVTHPDNPVRIGGATISLALSTISKLEWAPPDLLYLESGADVSDIGGVNLQTFLIGMNATADEIAAFPDQGRDGVDLNNDGDYGDPGETVPLPPQNPAEFFGKDFSVAASPPQHILDFDYDDQSGLLGMTLSGAEGILPAYRTVSTRTALLDPAAATFGFADFPDSRPKRVALFGNVLLEGTTPIVRNIAVVSLADISPSELAVLDVTEPLSPQLLKEIPLPNLGVPQTLRRRADGLLALATSDDVILLDPAKLLLDPITGGQLPAIVGKISGAGSGANSFAADVNGINAVNLGSKQEVIFTAPTLRFIAFSNAPAAASDLAALDTPTKLRLLSGATTKSVLKRSRFFNAVPGSPTPVLSVPDTNTHYYVRVDALGSLGSTLPLVIEGLNGAGQPITNAGPFNLPVRLASDSTLQAVNDASSSLPVPHGLNAFRLSNDPGSPLYDVYLAGPVTLSSSVLSRDQASQVEGQLARVLVLAGRFLWAGLDPSATVAPYPSTARSSIGNGHLLPGASAFAVVDNPRLPLILIPGVAGSDLVREDNDTQRWPGLSVIGKCDLSLDPAKSTVDIVASDIMRVVPEPYLGSRFTALNCKSAPIYEPLLNFLSQQAGLREYDYLKLSQSGLLGRLPVCFTGSPLTAQSGANMAAARTVRDYDKTQIPLDPDLFVFPYDWRQNNTNAAAQLKEYVEVIRRFHPEAEQVNILAHSMGGLVARRFILDNPGVVNTLITVGSPWLGAPKAINVTETGDFLEALQHVVLICATSNSIPCSFLPGPLVCSGGNLKDLVEFFPGPQQLMPSPAYFDLAGSPLVDRAGDLRGTPLGVGGGPLLFPAFQSVMDTVYHPDPRVAPAAVSEEFHTYSVSGVGQQDDWRDDHTGVQYFHILAVQNEPSTIGRVVSRLRIRPAPEDPVNLYQLKREFTLEYTTGDGTVPLISAARMNGGEDLNAPGRHLYTLVSPAPDQDKLYDHNGMLANTNLQSLVGRILDGDIPPDQPPPGSSGVTTYVVHIVNAASNEVAVTSFGNSGLANTEVDLGTDTADGQEVERINDVPGLRIDEPDTNIVDAVLEGKFDLTAHYDGRPISVRVEQQMDGVTQAAFIWENLDPRDFGFSAGTSFDVAIQVHSDPVVTAKPGGNALPIQPDEVITGAEARNDTVPTLYCYYTNNGQAIAFSLSRNGTRINLHRLFIDSEPELTTGLDPTARLRPFFSSDPSQDLVVPVALLLPLANNNQVFAIGETDGQIPSAELTVQLVTLSLTLNPSGEALEDWPAQNGHPRSPKLLLNLADTVTITVQGPPGGGSFAYLVDVASPSDPTGVTSFLHEISPGIYQNNLPQDAVKFVPPSAGGQATGVEIRDEELATFSLFDGQGNSLLQRDVMVDIGELAVATLSFTNTAKFVVDLTNQPSFDFQNEFVLFPSGFQWADAGFRVTFPDDVGSTGSGTANPMGRFIINFADPARFEMGEADLLFVNSHGTIAGLLRDHTTPPNVVITPQVDLIGVSAWIHDANFLILDACSTLFPGTGAGEDNWSSVLKASSRPIHGILGFANPVRANKNGFLDFLNQTRFEVPLTEAWTNAMTVAGKPWAYLFYQSAIEDTFRVISQQPLPNDQLEYAEYTGIFGNTCDLGPGDKKSQSSNQIPAGQGVFLDSALGLNQANPPAIPASIQIRPQPPLRTRGGEQARKQPGSHQEILRPAGVSAKLAVAAEDSQTAAAQASVFTQNELGLPPEYYTLRGVGEIRSQTIFSNSATPLKRDAFVAHYQQSLHGFPVEGSALLVEIGGDTVRRVIGQGLVEEVSAGETRSLVIASPADAVSTVRPELEALARISGSVVVKEGDLVWASDSASVATQAVPAGGEQLVPAWRLTWTAANSDFEQTVYVNAVTGKRLEVRP